ncbi:MAG: glycosyltransferase family 4 protein [Bryobacteraceae bacterium]|jgi:glycosyltransferase involved in cell wall biosynthesis
MRILHMDGGREMRGGQWQVLRLIEGLAAAGVESTLLAPADSPLAGTARERGWRVEPLGLVRAAILARCHDLVHAHDARAHTFAAIVGGAPLVVARRVAFEVSVGWKYERPRHYLAVSEFVKRQLMLCGIKEEKISVVYDGVPVQEVAAGDRVLALDNFDDPQKGTPLAVEAARLAGVELHLTQDLEHDLHRATALVYLTHAEGLGSAALLAMSAAVPVIASRVGGLPEVIRDRETGLLVKNEPPLVAAALAELAADPAFGRRLGRAARQAVIENFTVDHMVRRTMDVYHKVLS